MGSKLGWSWNRKLKSPDYTLAATLIKGENLSCLTIDHFAVLVTHARTSYFADPGRETLANQLLGQCALAPGTNLSGQG
eukprot:m.948764 g.948764  ORF g.948764 m.948764 type:complete len:79 (-) comp310539_c0_seq1:358-594(-)